MSNSHSAYNQLQPRRSRSYRGDSGNLLSLYSIPNLNCLRYDCYFAISKELKLQLLTTFHRNVSSLLKIIFKDFFKKEFLIFGSLYIISFMCAHISSSCTKLEGSTCPMLAIFITPRLKSKF